MKKPGTAGVSSVSTAGVSSVNSEKADVNEWQLIGKNESINTGATLTDSQRMRPDRSREKTETNFGASGSMSTKKPGLLKPGSPNKGNSNLPGGVMAQLGHGGLAIPPQEELNVSRQPSPQPSPRPEVLTAAETGLKPFKRQQTIDESEPATPVSPRSAGSKESKTYRQQGSL